MSKATGLEKRCESHRRRWIDVSLWITGALLFALVSGCKTTPEAPPSKPDPVLTDIHLEIGDRTISSFTATARATVENPRDEVLTIERVDYSLSARGERLREGAHDLSVTIPAGSEGEVRVPVAVEYSLALDDHMAIFGGEAVRPVFNGVVHGLYGNDQLEVPLNRAGRMRAPRIPEVSLETPDGARRKVDEVHATFRLRVHNDNNFEVRIGSLDYNLVVEGHQLRSSRVGVNQRLPASGVHVFTVEQDLSTQNVPELEERMSEGNRIEYRFQGEMRIGDLVVPFELEDEMRFAGRS